MSGPAPARRGRGLPLLLALVALVVVGRALVFDLRRVEGRMMAPALDPGETLLVRRVGPVAVGDVVLLHLGADPERYVKRVVAGPGAVVEEVRGHLLVDGRPLAVGEASAGLVEESDGSRQWVVRPGRGDTEPVTVPPGHWYVAGDDRVESRDSRHWGPIADEELDGVAVAVLPGGPGSRGGRWIIR